MLIFQGVVDGGVGEVLFSLDVPMGLGVEMLPWQDGCEGSSRLGHWDMLVQTAGQ